MTLHGLHYIELSDGAVRRARGFFDLYDAATQLGLLPARGGLGETALLLLRGFGLRRARTYLTPTVPSMPGCTVQTYLIVPGVVNFCLKVSPPVMAPGSPDLKSGPGPAVLGHVVTDGVVVGPGHRPPLGTVTSPGLKAMSFIDDLGGARGRRAARLAGSAAGVGGLLGRRRRGRARVAAVVVVAAAAGHHQAEGETGAEHCEPGLHEVLLQARSVGTPYCG